MFFDSWQGLARVILVGLPAYVALVLFLRVGGKRTLAKMSAYDLVVTVSLGSALASVVTSRDVALLEGLLTLALLIGLQFCISWTAVRSTQWTRWVKASPVMLFYDGDYCRDTMRRCRILEREILSAVRQSGIASLDDVRAVVLEPAGELSVLKHDGGEGEDALNDVERPMRRGESLTVRP